MHIGLAGVLSASLALGIGIGPAHGSTDATPTPPEDTSVEAEEAATVDPDLVAALSFIESIPEEVTSGSQEEYDAWIRENLPDELQTADGSGAVSVNGAIQVRSVNWVACGSAVGTAIVINLTPAKAVKIRSLIKAGGGAVTFARTFKSAYDSARATGLTRSSAMNAAANRAASAAGPETRTALLEFFAISSVAAACGLGD